MSKIRSLAIIIFLLLSIGSIDIYAQTPDTIQITPKTTLADSAKSKNVVNLDSVKADGPVKKDRRPRNAAIRSAIMPGWGQAYNHKYWKIPIIYAAGGVISYFYFTNVKTYRDNRDAYKKAVEGGSTDPNTNIYKINRDRFREYRDYNIAMYVGLYILNIIDANVDAHLKEFDVSDDLALAVKPYLYQDFYNSPVTGLTLNFKFKK